MNYKPYSAIILAFGGFLLICVGLYFIFLRPPLLPEDLRYMKSTLESTQEQIPGLLNWLSKVFWVMGGYIFTAGLLTVFIAFTSFRTRARGAFVVVVIEGLFSIVSMTALNFMIGSDFKWVLLAFTLPWVIALILYRLHK